jgi:SAM-dependent methyltransferase
VDVGDRVRDALPSNLPYDGLVAQAYDVWLPPEGNYDDRDRYRRAIVDGNGPALELGCGNGRLLIGYRRDGLDVSGVDVSADMLAICQAHADAANLPVQLHLADWLTLDLGRQFATLYNPAGSFALIDDVERARAALVAWRAHLLPGGRLYVAMGMPTESADASYEWRVRRSATRASDGFTFMVHEALRLDVDAQLEHNLNRHEVWGPDGELVTTFIRRHTLRWWTREQFEALLHECGYVDVRCHGTDAGFLAVGCAAS